MANTLFVPSSWIFCFTASRSVTSASPYFLSSITTGIRFAVSIALRQVFWSIRDHITYFFYGFLLASINNPKDMAIPVANGRIKTLSTNS
jgi:hypothetical protein